MLRVGCLGAIVVMWFLFSPSCWIVGNISRYWYSLESWLQTLYCWIWVRLIFLNMVAVHIIHVLVWFRKLMHSSWKVSTLQWLHVLQKVNQVPVRMTNLPYLWRVRWGFLILFCLESLMSLYGWCKLYRSCFHRVFNLSKGCFSLSFTHTKKKIYILLFPPCVPDASNTEMNKNRKSNTNCRWNK